MIDFAPELPDLLTLSLRARQRLHDWWQPDLGDVCVDMRFGEQDEETDILIAGDTRLLPTLDKAAYKDLLLWPTIRHLICYLDDHGLYYDPTTGVTKADGIPADQLLAWLWDRTKAHLESA